MLWLEYCNPKHQETKINMQSVHKSFSHPGAQYLHQFEMDKENENLFFYRPDGHPLQQTNYYRYHQNHEEENQRYHK